MNQQLPQISAEELYEHAPCGYLSTLPDGIIIRVNQTLLTWIGYARSDLLHGRRFQELLTVPGRIFYETHYAPLLRMQGFVREIAFDLICKDQTRLPILLNATQQQDACGQPLQTHISIFDARERRQYERELLLARRKAEHLATVVHYASDAIVSLSAEGVIQSWNPAAERMFGYVAAEAIGRRLGDLIIPTDYAEEYQRILGELGSGQAVQLEIECVCQGGQRFSAAISLTPHVEAPDQLVASSLILRDITERKRAEAALLALNARLEQEVQKRTAELIKRVHELDEFSYVTSHDLKSPLRAIAHLARWISDDAASVLPPASQEHLAKLQGRIQRMEKLLDDLLAYSRADRVQHQVELVDTATLVEKVASLVVPPAGFVVTVQSPMPVARTQRVPLETVLRNLISNAIKHHDRTNGQVQIAAREVDAFVEFSVMDDGPGIAPEHYTRIFQLFQTLRPRDQVEGSGVGLAMVKKLIESRGGQICVISTPGQGATFRFTWPTAQAPGAVDLPSADATR